MKNPYLALWLRQNTEVVKVGKGYAIRFKKHPRPLMYYGARRHGKNTLFNRIKKLWQNIKSL